MKKVKKKLCRVLPRDWQSNARITYAVTALVSALDRIVPSWRADTLGHGTNSDDINSAWDNLIAELEGEQ